MKYVKSNYIILSFFFLIITEFSVGANSSDMSIATIYSPNIYTSESFDSNSINIDNNREKPDHIDISDDESNYKESEDCNSSQKNTVNENSYYNELEDIREDETVYTAPTQQDHSYSIEKKYMTDEYNTNVLIFVFIIITISLYMAYKGISKK